MDVFKLKGLPYSSAYLSEVGEQFANDLKHLKLRELHLEVVLSAHQNYPDYHFKPLFELELDVLTLKNNRTLYTQSIVLPMNIAVKQIEFENYCISENFSIVNGRAETWNRKCEKLVFKNCIISSNDITIPDSCKEIEFIDMNIDPSLPSLKIPSHVHVIKKNSAG